VYCLIHNEWSTNLANVTNEQGNFGFRGFYGNYEVITKIGNSFHSFDLACNRIKEGTEFVLQLDDVVSSVQQKVEKNAKIDVAIYPNPFNNSLNLDITYPYNNLLKVELYNSMGQLITTLHKGRIEEYKNISYSAPQLSSGVYFVRITGKHLNTIKKVILLK